MALYQRVLQAMSIIVNKTGRGLVLRPVGAAWCVSSQKEPCSPSPINQDCHVQATTAERPLPLLPLSPSQAMFEIAEPKQVLGTVVMVGECYCWIESCRPALGLYLDLLELISISATVCVAIPTLCIFSSLHFPKGRKGYIDFPCLPTLTDNTQRGDVACPGLYKDLVGKLECLWQALCHTRPLLFKNVH